MVLVRGLALPRLFSFVFFWLFHVLWSFPISVLICLFDFLYSRPLQCYGTLWTLIFFFSFYLFFLILYFFSFEFLFLFLFIDNEEACDIAVTWQVTECDIIGLEQSRRIWKMMSGHMVYTWWPWVRHKANMR